MARRCVMCPYCRRTKPTKTSRFSYGRSVYYCAHRYVHDLPESVFRSKGFGVIGLGDATPGSALKMKTHPRWCPMELFKDNHE